MRDWHLQRTNRIVETQHVRQLAITETTSDLVATIDIDGFFIELNRAGYELLCLHEDTELRKLRLVSFFTKESTAAFIKYETPNAVICGASHSEVNLVSASGLVIPSSQVLIAHKDSMGNVEYFSVILRDIRSIKAAEHERETLIEQLHQSKKIETVGRLAGGVAHDLNNIMSVIMGRAELALRRGTCDEKIKSEFEIILNSAEKAARLSSQLLDFSSKQKITPQVLNLNEVLHNSQQLIESLMGEGITIKLSTDPALWPIKIDRSQLEQIILNLAVNSRDAMGERGTFSLKTENLVLSGQDAKWLGLASAGDYIGFCVSDDGCGIDEKLIEKIFDPFFTTKDKGKGTGLGLSAVYGAVKQNSGFIRTLSTVGEGTSFEIYFPREDSDSNVLQIEVEGKGGETQHNGSESILLVEDNEAVRNILATILADLGYTVLKAGDGVQALEILNADGIDIDLVVSDVIMPKMNGMELYRELQKIDTAAKLLLISGHTDQIISTKELDESNVILLNKPFPIRKFAELVRGILDNTAARNPKSKLRSV